MLALPKVQFESSADFPAARWLYDFLTRQCVFYRPDIDLLQTASPPGMSTDLMLNAANLPWLVLELQNEQEKFAAWVEHVKTALPQVTAIRAIEREEDHHAYLAVTYNGGYEVTLSGLSEGTLRILALTVLPYLARRPALIINEEPNNLMTRRPLKPFSIRFSRSTGPKYSSARTPRGSRGDQTGADTVCALGSQRSCQHCARH